MRVRQLLAVQAEQNPNALALGAPNREPLRFARLLAQVERVAKALHLSGIGRNDRVAIVLPNGPEAAAAFLSVSAAATTAPLNPGYREAEFEFYLSDLNAKALLIARDLASPARVVAKGRGIPILEMDMAPHGGAGEFELAAVPHGNASLDGWAEPEDLALVLHTSGTTSRPKIVPLTQANVCASAANIARTLALTRQDRCLNIMPLFHIHGLMAAVLASLGVGASVICTPGLFAPKFFEWMDEFRPTWYTAVPTMHQTILARAAANRDVIARSPLRFIRSSSAALSPQVLIELERVFHTPVIEAYGMTEAAHQMASNPLPPGQHKPGSVGGAAGSEIAIMGEAGNLLSRGVVGEIVIRGENVTRGYEGNAEANATAFINGWFRTGDSGYLDAEGYLFIAGRIKELINRGGEKISPREVDEALLDHPVVAQAVTFALPDERLGEEVGAAVVLREGGRATERELREYVSLHLADFKVPRRIVILDEIPKGPTGKVQRIGLAEKLGLRSEPARGEPYIAPRTALEQALSALWSNTLGVPRVGARDDFIRLGGDSILAAQLVARVSEALNVQISLIALFDEAATVEGMAELVEKLRHSAARPFRAIPKAAARESSPALSFVQERFWFLQQLEPGSIAYNRSLSFRIQGELDIASLEQSLNEIVQRHAVLRSRIVALNGVPVQTIVPPESLPLLQLDLNHTPTDQRESEAQRVARIQVRQPFDLATDSPIRAILLHLDARAFILLLVLHHSVSDGWSDGILSRELSQLYDAYVSGKPAPLAELPFQYADHAAAQRAELQGQVLDDQLSYWQQQLEGELAPLELPTDRPRPPIQTDAGARHIFHVPADLLQALDELARGAGVTRFMLLLAAFQTLLCRYTNQTDITVGVPIAGRTEANSEKLIGCFMNTLVLRTNFSGEPTFRELLARVRKAALGAYAHQELPFEKLIEALQPTRSLSRSPLFQVFFQLRNLRAEPMTLGHLQIEPWRFDAGVAPFDLTVDLDEEHDGLRGSVDYNADLFDAATIERLTEHYQILLEAVTRDAEMKITRLPILTDAERRQLLVEWNNTRVAFPRDVCLHQLFEREAVRTPEAVAVVFQEHELTYRELNERANQLAHHLQKRGVGPEVLVGIAVERSLEMIVGLLGILKAGGAYVPLDPGYPRERLAFMLEDTKAPVLITQSALRAQLPEFDGQLICLDADWEGISCEPNTNLCLPMTPRHLALVIYTSGSTGNPKGAMIQHSSITDHVHGQTGVLGLTNHDRFLSVASFSFDASVFDFFQPLALGARVIIADDEERRDGTRLAALIEASGATVMAPTPAMCRMLLDSGWRSASHLTLIMGGEALDRDLADRLLDVGAKVWNSYGPTETTIDSTTYRVERSTRTVPIGKPHPNTTVYVFDPRFELVPVGVAGELHVGGVGVARGYLNRPELTAERFLPNPFRFHSVSGAHESGSVEDAVLYKTGDKVRYQPDGNLVFLGRLDSQVKLRGYRIELGEIEGVLQAQPGVSAALVLLREDQAGEPRLAAYVIPQVGAEPVAAELRRSLARSLPDFMVPSTFVIVENFPVLPNGKLDRRALPVPDAPRSLSTTAPRTLTEARVAGIWAEVLRLQRVGVEDTFFDLGGHSLLASQIISRVRDDFQLDIPLRSIFEAPTVALLAQTIDEIKMVERVSAPPLVQLPRTRQRNGPGVMQPFLKNRADDSD